MTIPNLFMGRIRAKFLPNTPHLGTDKTDERYVAWYDHSMNIRAYQRIIHKDPNSCFGVSFPDFPGCFSAGDTLEEAHAMADEALAFHIEGLIADGEEIPPPPDPPAVHLLLRADGTPIA